MTLQLSDHYLADMLHIIAKRPQSIRSAACRAVMERGGDYVTLHYYILAGRELAKQRRITELCVRFHHGESEAIYEVTG